ncbi:KNR4/SMI1 homolog [Daucus carota subsp. sativus]|uniref:KNR4/SMI1 homolog n=1 Tax=Daucus carota subsp. sativus TaxID=79200 RepID=UPI003082CB99
MPESAAYITNGDTNLRSMMNALGYSESLEKLGQLKRPGLRREWSFFFDCITRAFQKKSTNWDAIPMDMLQIGLHKRVFKDLISKDEKYPIQRPLLIPAPVRARMDLPPVQQQQPQQQQPQPPISPTATKQPRSSASKSKKATKSDENPSTVKTRTSVATQVLKTKSDKPANSDAVNTNAVNTDAVNSEAASPPKQKRRRLVAAYDYDDLEPTHASNSEPSPTTNSEPLQASPQPKTARFKRRANKPKRAKAVPISATASSTSSEVDEEIICKEKADAETTVSDSQIPVSDHGPSTPIPHSPLKFPEGAIIHDTAPENYKSDAVVEESDKIALEALQSLAKASEEPSKSKAEVQEKSVPDLVENVEDPASDDDKDDESSDDDNDDEDEVPLSHLQQKWESTSQGSQNRGSQFQRNSKYGQEKAPVTSKGRHEEAGVCQ